jgi:hypothetical protein
MMLFIVQAAELAINASVKFLEDLAKDPSIDKMKLAEFIGLTTGTTLCFVVDTTGSMSEEIAGGARNNNQHDTRGRFTYRWLKETW